jgi:hypothetical protein
LEQLWKTTIKIFILWFGFLYFPLLLF